MAVYTEVPDSEVQEFLTHYNIGEVTALKGIAEGVENTNFFLSTTEGQYILTLYEKRVNADDLPFFLGLMDHLSQKGLSCPQVISDKKGQQLGRLCDRPAAITGFLQGMWPRRIKPVHCKELGRAMAQLHQAAADFTLERPNSLSLEGWGPILEACREKGNSVQDGLIESLDHELSFLQENWPGTLPTGVIHADLFQDNVFFLDEKLSGLIDFYFACNDILTYDLAICLNAWCFEEDNSFNVTKARLMLKAYQGIRPLSEAELEALPVLARGAALRFLLTRLFDWINHPEGAFVKPKDPLEYVRKLKFHQSVKSVRDYGL
ncbi:homoserine kinase [Kiloniella sp. b19]|uniref:homoserine kinase n=1 Tax=Kiloniella sp. GXU_MW_B19 TaxID=3141326 RepID=UPI0031D40111